MARTQRQMLRPYSLAVTMLLLLMSNAPEVEPSVQVCQGPTSALPAPGSELVHPNTFIQFVNIPCGTLGKRSEDQHHFTLFEETDEAPKPALVPSAPSTVGHVTIIKPLVTLKTGARYRLESSDSPDPITSFTVGNPRDLPDPANEPMILRISQGEASHWVSVQFKSAGIDPSSASLFFWELLYRSKADWVPIQRTSTHRWYSSSGTAPASPTANQWLEIQRIDVGSNIFSPGPVFPEGVHDIRLDLVRADGRRWSTPVQTIVVTYWYHKLPCSDGTSPEAVAGVYTASCVGISISCNEIVLNPDGTFETADTVIGKARGSWLFKRPDELVLTVQDHPMDGDEGKPETRDSNETLSFYYHRCTLYPIWNRDPLRLGQPYGKSRPGT